MPDEAISKLLYNFVTPESVTRIQGPYVRLFTEVGARKVLDLGSGRGLFLELLKEAGIEAHGVDSDEQPQNGPSTIRAGAVTCSGHGSVAFPW